jgi:heme/copper-type cytochrome/quinol oxidase subunit 2
MDKIQTIEQLDKVGLKICEMMNVSIDKASTIIPETFQQYIQYVIVTDVFLLMLFPIIIFVCWFARRKFLHSKIVIENDEQEEVTIVITCICIVISFFSILIWVVCILDLIEAILAPNILFIEKLSELSKTIS